MQNVNAEKNIACAVAYYQAMHNKDLAVIEKSLHPDVHLIGPLAELTGKEAVLNSVKHFLSLFKTLTIRARCGNGDHQVMLAYDLECPAPIGRFRGAALLTFEDGLIRQYELFYDARPFEKKDGIFVQS